MTVTIDGGAGVTFPDGVQQTNGLTITGGAPLYYAARAWVSFSGFSGNIRAQANVASVNRNSTGLYTVTFTAPMPDANYAIIATAGVTSSADMYYNARTYGTPSAASFGIMVVYQSSGSPTYIDPNFINVVVFR
jgi:hypothetical protein